MSAPEETACRHDSAGCYIPRPNLLNGQLPEWSLTGSWDWHTMSLASAQERLGKLEGLMLGGTRLTENHGWLLGLILTPSFKVKAWRAVGWMYLVKQVLFTHGTGQTTFVVMLNGQPHSTWSVTPDQQLGYGFRVLESMLETLVKVDLLKRQVGTSVSEGDEPIWGPTNALIQLLDELSTIVPPTTVAAPSPDKVVVVESNKTPKQDSLPRVTLTEEDDQQGLYPVITPPECLSLLPDLPSSQSLTAWKEKLAEVAQGLTSSDHLVLNYLLEMAAEKGTWCWCTSNNLMRRLQDEFRSTPEATTNGIAFGRVACEQALQHLVALGILTRETYLLEGQYTGYSQATRYCISAAALDDLKPSP